MIRTILKLAIGLIAIYFTACLWAYSTQVAIYSQDIPRNMVCVKDTYPNAYICIHDQDVPWYLSEEGVLAHVK